jgi:NAD(P)-dependent dehydrogenase (short-subunit alcohol dehydrogenase family)
VKADVSNEDSVIALVQETVKMYGRLDYAFNNAGVVEDPAPFASQMKKRSTIESIPN